MTDHELAKVLDPGGGADAVVKCRDIECDIWDSESVAHELAENHDCPYKEDDDAPNAES